MQKLGWVLAGGLWVRLPPLKASSSLSAQSSHLHSSTRGPSARLAMAQVRTSSPTEMERSMEKIITIFQRYSGKEGNQATMDYKEFEIFMKTELASFTKNQKDPQILQKMMNSVDGGVDGKKDKELDFQEFLNLIGGIMVACNDALAKCPPAKKNPVQATPPTEMESAMESIIRVFQHYAGKKGDKNQLNYTEFEALMKAELKSFTDAAAPRAEGRLLLLAVILCLCCSPVTCKKDKSSWMERIKQDLDELYYSYAKMEGNPKTLNCKEFHDLLKDSVPSFLEGKDPKLAEKIVAAMDGNKDGEMDYNEFYRFRTHVVMAKYKVENKQRQ